MMDTTRTSRIDGTAIEVSTAQLIMYRLDKQDAVLDEIREHVRMTNGRVTAIELARERERGAADALQKERQTSRNWTQWAITTLIAIVSILLTCGAVATGIVAL